MLYIVILIVALVICAFSFVADEGQFVGIAFLAVVALAPLWSYMNHADNLGTIRAQQGVVQVYDQRVQELNAQLKKMVPEGAQKNPLQLNADSPVRGIVESVTKANTDLANARVAIAKAKVSIAKRKAGPFSFIVRWFGEV